LRPILTLSISEKSVLDFLLTQIGLA